MHLCKIRYREISGVHIENKEESNMIRRVIQIEEDKCNGCGAFATSAVFPHTPRLPVHPLHPAVCSH